MNAADWLAVLRYEPTSGVFRWRVSRGKARAGKTAGGPNKSGYIRITFEGHQTYAHRLAWLVLTGYWPAVDLDHRNGDVADNRIANLRLAPQSDNQQNRDLRSGRGASPLVGVALSRAPGPNPWRAGICVNRRNIHLGCFPTAELAHEAYLRAKREMHPFAPVGRMA